ncbi:hypothetical protein M426DRAFT_323802 [Hypoxylon sp. CI-4A]|nr:hypothetical protein M426DRAFT_323802 [Hypoxylon sp. CI-4A]
MSTNQPQRSISAMSTRDRDREKTTTTTYFEQQREALIGEIAMSFEHVLANINKLNRSLEAVTAVGNEFSSVEALWSQFESVMAHNPAEDDGRAGSEEGEGEGHTHQQHQQHEGEGERDAKS